MSNKIENKIGIRIFGSSDCHHCSKIKEEFDQLGIVYEFIDANADDTQEICDEYNVNVLPHTQAIRDGKIIFEKSGPYSASHFLADVSKKLSRGRQEFPIVKNAQNGCPGCKKKN
jgi:thiol-disulfide isomerase/thioredoxin